MTRSADVARVAASGPISSGRYSARSWRQSHGPSSKSHVRKQVEDAERVSILPWFLFGFGFRLFAVLVAHLRSPAGPANTAALQEEREAVFYAIATANGLLYGVAAWLLRSRMT